MFRCTQGKGWHLTVNGWTISVQYGHGNYCANRDAPYGAPDCESPDAEIAVWDPQGVWVDYGHDTVAGWVSPETVARVIGELQRSAGLQDGTRLLPCARRTTVCRSWCGTTGADDDD